MRDPLHLTLLLPSPVFDRSVRFGPRDVRHNHLTALGRGGVTCEPGGVAG